MAQKLAAGMPFSISVPASWTLQFAAVDPTSGAAVSGVTVSGAVILATLTQGSVQALSQPATQPLWVPVALDAPA